LARQDAPPQAIERVVEIKAEQFEYIGRSYKMAFIDSQRCFIFSGSGKDTLWGVAFLDEDILLREVNLISATPTETERQVYQVELYDLLLGAAADTADWTFKNRGEPEAVLQFKTGDARMHRRQKLTEYMSLGETSEFLSGNGVGILVTRMPQLLDDQGGKSCLFGVNLHAATIAKQ
jgi:hypothetical protein